MTDGGSIPQRRNTASIVWLLAYLLAGPLIWAVQFSTVYALHTLACAASPAPAEVGGWLLVSMAMVTVACVAAALVILACRRRIKRAILGSMDEAGWKAYEIISNVLIILTITAIIWSGLAVALLKPCA